MSRVSPKKLLSSKWTAVEPKNKEKHFVVTEVEFDEEGAVEICLIEAVMSKRLYEIDWRSLNDKSVWLQGWK